MSKSVIMTLMMIHYN